MRCAVLLIAAGLAHAQTYDAVAPEMEEMMETSYGLYDRQLTGSSAAGSGSYATTTTAPAPGPTTTAPAPGPTTTAPAPGPTTATPTNSTTTTPTNSTTTTPTDSTTTTPTDSATTTAPAPAPNTTTTTTTAPAPAPKVSFKTGLGGISKTNFEKPNVQLAYKEKIAAEINKQSTKHDHDHRRRLSTGGIKAEDIELKNIADDGNGGITFEVEITVKTTSGAGTDVAALATEVQNRANNLIEKLQSEPAFANTFKAELKVALETAGGAGIIDDQKFNDFKIGAATTSATVTKSDSGGSGAAIGGAVAGVLVVGGLAFMFWKKKQGGGGFALRFPFSKKPKVTPTN